MVDIQEDLNIGYLMLLTWTFLGMFNFFDKIITAQENRPYLTVLHRKESLLLELLMTEVVCFPQLLHTSR